MSRAEIYVSDLLLVQYSTQKGKPKSSVNYETVSGVLQVVLMKNSPKNFDQPTVGDRYIHRFSTQVADSGLVYQKPLKETIFVQLDKCFEQFLEGKDGENDPETQILLSALYNVNEPKILEHTKDNDMLKDIVAEVRRISEDKEVQAMLLSEKYVEADLNAVKSYERREGVQEGMRKGEMSKGIAVYKNMLARGYSKEEALAVSEIPKEVADAI